MYKITKRQKTSNKWFTLTDTTYSIWHVLTEQNMLFSVLFEVQISVNQETRFTRYKGNLFEVHKHFLFEHILRRLTSLPLICSS